MDAATPFAGLFRDVYPQRRCVDLTSEPHLVGVLIKSVFFHRQEENLLCRGLVLHGHHVAAYTTVNLKITGIAPVVGYDLDLQDENETWTDVKYKWSRHFAAEPAYVEVLHEDIKRKTNAVVFPVKSISAATSYIKNVKGALTFGDFCPDRGFYLSRDGNTPALCSDVMFGRTYFVPAHKLSGCNDVRPSDLIYDHQKSELEAKAFDGKHAAFMYKAACLDIETVFDESHRDLSLRCDAFAYKFPYCTEQLVADITGYREKLTRSLNTQRKELLKHSGHVSIPTLSPDMAGQQHEITCVSLVILNTHEPKPTKGHRRKKLIVLYNKNKVIEGRDPEPDCRLTKDAGIDDVKRIMFYPCSGELALLERLVVLLHKCGIELLYVYNAEFDIRVLEQRVHFYAESNYSRLSDPATQKRCSRLLKAWHGLFIDKELFQDGVPLFQFESVRYLGMYRDMIQNVGAVLSKGPLTEYKLRQVALHVDTFNKEKAKLGHFKMNSCGMNIIDLYRMAGTRDIKYECTSMKLNDVAPYVISKVRELHKKPQKDVRKLCKLADVSYEKMDSMINSGGKGLFAVLVYNLVDSQLCSRLAKVLNPVSALFHRCRTTLNIDVIVHGRGDNFGGFVQSIHSVQVPQLKFTLDTLRVKSGPLGAQLETRKRWDPKLESGETWKGGAVCDPLTGLHYSGPGMGLELSFDFSSMYPSIMCALNISPETTVPWPPKDFPHDLSGWVCYSWEAEGFKYASLVLKYDKVKREFTQAPGVFASSVAYYLNQRADYKRKIQNPEISDSDRMYYKMQEGECKVLANSFYGTAPHPCGPLISGHGRQQISVVNNCVSRFYQHKCPVVYGDTDSVMVAAGYGPGDAAEADLSDVKVGTGSLDAAEEKGELHRFAHQARTAMGDKFKRAGEQVPGFLDYVHAALVDDVLRRMYVIGPHNEHQRVIRDPKGSLTKQGYPVYLANVPGGDELLDVTEAFVKDRRVKLEYENSCSVYCHVAKKTYVALTHTVDDTNEISSISVKVRGLAAFKSMRSPCDSAVTETFVSCVMRGDCVKLQTDQVSCFTTCPWHQLQRGDDILYFKQEPTFDKSGRWLELNQASSFLTAYKVSDVIKLAMDRGFSAVSVRLVPLQTGDASSLVVRTLHKYGKYCMNHMFSRKQGVLRDLLVNRACEIIASKMGAGFFPWSSLIKSAKSKHFSLQTLERLKVSKSSVKTTYVEIVKTWLQRITGLSVKPVECYEFYKCNPCEASFYRYPLNLQATSGCLTVMFGGSLLCETKKPCHSVESLDQSEGDLPDGQTRSPENDVINHPYQAGNLCYANSRVLTSHHVDRSLVNSSGKLLAHCIIDFCVPRHMYGSDMGTRSIRDCEHWLIIAVGAIRDRLKRATTTFNSVMNTCPEHMIPVCDNSEIELIASNRETVSRITSEKLETCKRVITTDMNLQPCDTYKMLCRSLRDTLTALMSQKLVSRDRDLISNSGCISVSVPNDTLKEAGVDCPNGRLSIARSDLHEKTLVDLAGLMYQTVLMLQLHKPDSFAYSAALYPKHVLCIMPYSCEDQTNMTTWMASFKEKKWLKDARPELGKRTLCAATKCKEVMYHCTGCKNFYRDLFANKVPVDQVICCIYDEHKKRRFGYCVNEKHWLF